MFFPKEVKKYIKEIIYTKNLFSESKKWWMEVLKDVDVCVHLAWYLKHDYYLISKKYRMYEWNN